MFAKAEVNVLRNTLKAETNQPSYTISQDVELMTLSSFISFTSSVYISLHYENTPMQYTEIFLAIKCCKFHQNFFFIFYIFAQNMHCGYKLEPPRRGGSNEYPQCMFWSKNKKNRYNPAYPIFAI